MASVERTTYPLLPSQLSAKKLHRRYSLFDSEIEWVNNTARSPALLIGLAICGVLATTLFRSVRGASSGTHQSWDETNSNFGFNLPWWDRLLGTYRAQPKEGHAGMTIGIAQFRTPRELWLDRLLMQPWRGPVSGYPINRQRTRSESHCLIFHQLLLAGITGANLRVGIHRGRIVVTQSTRSIDAPHPR